MQHIPLHKLRRLFVLSRAGRFVPQGGYPFNKYQGCISSLFGKALAPYFSMQAPEVLRVVRTYAFGVTEARQPHNAIVVTMRAPEHLKVARLPGFVLTPTGYMDHPSWHEAPGAVPQLGITKVKWFLKGRTYQNEFIVVSDASESADPAVVQQLRDIDKIESLGASRLQRAYEEYKHKVQRLARGADTSHIRHPGDSNREKKRRAKREAYQARQAQRSSRSRSRSRSPSAGRAVAPRTQAAEPLAIANRFSHLGSVLEAGEIEEAERDADAVMRAAAAIGALPLDADPLTGVPAAALEAAPALSADAHMPDAHADLR